MTASEDLQHRCPDGNPVRLQHPLGFRERSIGELELRIALTDGDYGACDVLVREHADEVCVRVLVCYDVDKRRDAQRPRHYIDCPVRVWLDEPLGDRAVIDIDRDEELPLYVPEYLDNTRQPNAGYHRVTRRKRSQNAADQSPRGSRQTRSNPLDAPKPPGPPISWRPRIQPDPK